MKTATSCYENYPWHIVVLTNLFSMAIYIAGIIILVQTGMLPVLLYIAIILFLEFRLLKVSCTKCYYYNRYCAFGKGKLSALLFKMQDPSLFQKKNFSWYSLLPDMLVLLIPLLVGIYLLIIEFNWFIVFLLLFLIVLATFGNGFVRGTMACNHCRQRELGCKAEQFFNKNKN